GPHAAGTRLGRSTGILYGMLRPALPDGRVALAGLGGPVTGIDLRPIPSARDRGQAEGAVMTSGDSMRLLTINTGSSSLKAALYHMDEAERLDLSALVERIGLPGSRLHIVDARGTVLVERGDDLPDHGAAMRALLAWLRDN